MSPDILVPPYACVFRSFSVYLRKILAQYNTNESNYFLIRRTIPSRSQLVLCLTFAEYHTPERQVIMIIWTMPLSIQNVKILDRMTLVLTSLSIHHLIISRLYY